MPFVVDDLLEIPVQLFAVVFNAIIQTSYKSMWAEYKRKLNILLMRLRRDYEEGKLSRAEMKKLETQIFQEMRLANRVLGGS